MRRMEQKIRTRQVGRHLLSATLALLVTGLFFSAWDWQSYAQNAESAKAVVVTIDGAIGPAIGDYLSDSLDKAAEEEADIFVLALDTPGGLVSTTRKIIKDILSSPVPVATYVSPAGAHAASAGTYILYGSHIAAMAPGTNVGAATPVEIGGPSMPDRPSPPTPPSTPEESSPTNTPDVPSGEGSPPVGSQEDSQESTEEAKPSAPEGAASMKAVNDLVAFIKELADLRGRNVEWAEKAVREAATLPANEALSENVIDVIAKDIPDLLNQIDGKTVEVDGEDFVLNTADAQIVNYDMDFVTRFLVLITDPNVSFIFMTLAMYGLFFELANPGSIFPGVVGVICLIIGLYALSVLPVSSAGLALLVVGFVLLVAEVFTPTFGILGLGGLVSFFFGAAFLFRADEPGFGVSLEIIIGATATTAAFFAVVGMFALGAQRRKVVTGVESLIGTSGEVLEWEGEHGYVRVMGERWQARSKDELSPGDSVTVIKSEGLTLVVRRGGQKRQRRILG